MPVVATPVGAEGLVVGGCLPPLVIGHDIGHDTEEIACATAKLLAADAARRALGRHARAFVAEYHSWSAYRQRLETLSCELLSERPSERPVVL